MDNFFLLQIIEKIPEFRFKCFGSYHSDNVPQPKKHSFAIIFSAPCNDGGEHLIPRLDKTYYFAASYEKKTFQLFFFRKSSSA